MRELNYHLRRKKIWDWEDEADFGIYFPGRFTQARNMFIFGFLRRKLLRNWKSYTKIVWIRQLYIFNFEKIGVWSNSKARLYEFGVHRKHFAKFSSKAWYAVKRHIAHSSSKAILQVFFDLLTMMKIFASHIHFQQNQKMIKYFAELILIQRWWKIFNWLPTCPVLMSSNNTLNLYFLILSVLNLAACASTVPIDQAMVLAWDQYQVIINEFYQTQSMALGTLVSKTIQTIFISCSIIKMRLARYFKTSTMVSIMNGWVAVSR